MTARGPGDHTVPTFGNPGNSLTVTDGRQLAIKGSPANNRPEIEAKLGPNFA
jgi:hypothetical protein